MLGIIGWLQKKHGLARVLARGNPLLSGSRFLLCGNTATNSWGLPRRARTRSRNTDVRNTNVGNTDVRNDDVRNDYSF
ncbi:MAG: hypothetical protein V4722_27235 [Bacteroidota bacterium]